MYGELPLEGVEPQDIVEQAQDGTLCHPRSSDSSVYACDRVSCFH